MKKNLTRKIIEEHLVEGEPEPGKEIGIRIDQTLLQDATGTLAMLEFESMGVGRVRAELSAQYVDHNLLQTDHRNADDHRYLQTACRKYGIHFSAAGNGVSHQVHMERFGIPGKTMLGADSHTPGAAGVGMLAIGAGGLDVALAMTGAPYYLTCPRVLGVKLTGRLPDWVSAKDVILEMLRRYGVKGCVGKIIEYYGPGVETLSATDRETIANMGTETGATTTVFPSDDNTKAYLESQGRGGDYRPLAADEGATYDEHDEIDLSKVEPLIACPSSPGNVVPVREVAGKEVHQAIVGSSVNSSFRDLMVSALMLEGRHISPNVAMHINPGSRQVIENVFTHGGGLMFLKGGAMVKEPGCLGCIGMGQAPGTHQVSLRTFPRNFPGRSGTVDDQVYLCSPETATAAAIKGRITDPRDLAEDMAYPRVQDPERYVINESSIYPPAPEGEEVEVIRGPNIKPFPELEPLPETIEVETIKRVGDNISTDTILQGGNKVLPLRSNIEAISRYVFYQIDPDFPEKCEGKTGAIVGGINYGQGSSREHAALAPRYLGIRVVVAKSFARIHKANLCNFGILPLVLENADDYDRLTEGGRLYLDGIRAAVERGDSHLTLRTDDAEIPVRLEITDRQRESILAGGAINRMRAKAAV